MKFLEAVKKAFTKHIPLKILALVLAVFIVVIANAIV